jgi:hypothetical protein
VCSLAGVIDPNDFLCANLKRKLIRSLLIAGQVRGRDASGIAFLNGNDLRIIKAGKPARRFRFYLPEKTKIVIAHNRAASQGSPRHNFNNHPLSGHAGDQTFTLCHNGVIWNDEQLRKQFSLPPTPIETDSFIACQLLEQYGKLDFESLKWIAETVKGSFSFTLLDDLNNLYIIKGINPIELVLFEEIGVYVFASTEEILNRALSKSKLYGVPHKKIPLIFGDILKIDACGGMERSSFNAPVFEAWDYYFPNWHIPLETGSSLHELLEEAKIAGIDEDEITELFYSGYSVSQIEELLETPSLLRERLDDFELGCNDDFEL